MIIYTNVLKDGFEFTQLICCLCQNGITKSIIKHLVNKYLHEYGNEKTQIGSIKTIKQAIIYFQWYISFNFYPKLKLSDLINVLDCLLVLLDEKSLRQLRKTWYHYNEELVECRVR